MRERIEKIMKVIFMRDILLAALTPAAAVANTKNTMATVEGILFECPGDGDGTCRITSYDMEKGLRTTIEATILEEGSYIINAQNILQIVKSMPQGEITIEIDDRDRVKITGGNSFFEINAIPGEKYPSLPLLAGERVYKIPQYIFRELISKTAFAAAVNAQKAIFNGVFFKIEGGVMKCVGCDGNRLGLAECDLEGDSPDASFIVPAKMLYEIQRMTHDTEDEIEIMLARKHVIFMLDGFTYFSRLIDGEYLNYERIIPDKFERSAFINRAAITGAAERASIVTEDKLGTSTAKTYIKLEFEENELKISSASTGGSVHENIPVSMTGENLVIAFNCRFLLDALKAASEAETVCFKMNGPLMGICIEAAEGGEEEKNPVRYTLFVMPLRMNSK